MKPDRVAPTCPLCADTGGHLVWQDAEWRVVRVEDADFPAFYRVIANRHVAEFSDLAPAERRRCMELVVAVERVLIDRLQPAKVNLAALGNMVAHLHWHVVARFEWDSHFPQPIWGVRRRETKPGAEGRLRIPLGELDQCLIAALRQA